MIASRNPSAIFQAVVVEKVLAKLQPGGLNVYTTFPPIGYSLSDFQAAKALAAASIEVSSSSPSNR